MARRVRWHHLLLVACVHGLTSCGGCSGEEASLTACTQWNGDASSDQCYEPWSDRRSAVTSPTDCQISLCLTGAINQRSGSNASFQAMCDLEPITGLVRDCRERTCYSAFDSFSNPSGDRIYPELFDVLDSNGDARIDGADERCQINLIGFSWGGVTAIKLSELLAEDERVARDRRHIERMLLLDPYRPSTQLVIPENVNKVRVWRQSESPKTDCSRFSPGGPYAGLKPDCSKVNDCLDVNISTLDQSIESGLKDVRIAPRDVGHCDVPLVARDWVLDALWDMEHTVSDNPARPHAERLLRAE